MYIWLSIWLLLIIYGMKPNKIKENDLYEGLSYHNTLPIRGILAIEIVFGHFYGSLSDSRPAWIGSKIGVLVVGMFLFLSGWGLWESKENKENYFEGFIKKHMISIILPVYMLYLFNLFLNAVPSHYSLERVIKGIFGSEIIGFTNWFIWQILAFYMLFYLLYKNLKQKTGNYILLGIIIVWNIYACTIQIGTRWYGSTLCFILGIYFAQNKRKLSHWITKYYVKIFAAMIFLALASALSFMKVGKQNIFLEALFISMSAIFSSIIMAMLLLRFRFRNSVTFFLGKISYEIFIIHFTFIHFFKEICVVHNDILYIAIVLGATIITSAFVFKAKKIIY